ncbi:MAG: NUDIX hydrolase [Burkholderiaceae bacterium]|nr:NUDIX hydrolase [Microbacteriaceae bacterium]
MTTAPSVVVAAGVVCWRKLDGELQVLLVNRDARADVSLPKGKVDPGESLPEAAVRETLEETGLRITLGAALGVTEYTMPGGRDKIVHYWSAEVSDAALEAATFTPGAEVASTVWLPIAEARVSLSYGRDRDILDRVAERSDANLLRTFAIIMLRHGKAVPATSWSGTDSTRPLEHVGLEQARKSARVIAAFHPTKLISSTAARCISTIEPVASITGLNIKATAAISQDTYEDGESDVRRVVDKRLSKRATTVLCSHGPVLPEILAQLAAATGHPWDDSLRRASMLATGDFAVAHVSRARQNARIVALEVHSPSDF